MFSVISDILLLGNYSFQITDYDNLIYERNLKKVIFLLLCIAACNRPIEKCTISGGVIGRSSNSFIFINEFDRPDPTVAKIHIPVKDSTFSYEFNAIPKQVYRLILVDNFSSGDRIYPITIFPDKKRINLILYNSKHYSQNKFMEANPIISSLHS